MIAGSVMDSRAISSSAFTAASCCVVRASISAVA
jgi:hypothetical protein